MQDAYKTIMSLKRTEKGTKMLPLNKYMFWVSMPSTKIDIKHSVEQLYKVKVQSVNTCIMRGKMKRVRYKEGKTADWKKAIVTLKQGEKIEIT